MSLDEAKHWLGHRYVLHVAYRAEDHPWHSAYARVDLRETFIRVRTRMHQEHSFVGAVEQVKQKLRLIHGRVA